MVPVVPSQAGARMVATAYGLQKLACCSLEEVHSRLACHMARAGPGPIASEVGTDVAVASGEAALVAETDGTDQADMGQSQVACPWAPTERDLDELVEAGAGVVPGSVAFLGEEG